VRQRLKPAMFAQLRMRGLLRVRAKTRHDLMLVVVVRHMHHRVMRSDDDAIMAREGRNPDLFFAGCLEKEKRLANRPDQAGENVRIRHGYPVVLARG